LSASTHSPVLKHHFEDLHQQHSAERLGIWMFLATEVLFFAGLFGSYTVYRLWYPSDFEAGSSHLNRMIATVNTIFLITSSLTMTLAIRCAKLGDRAGLIRYLLFTAALGSAFMVMKGFEYNADFEERYVPGRPFQTEYKAASDEIAGKSHEAAEKHTFKPERQRWSREMAIQNIGKKDGDAGYVSPQRVQLFLCFYYIMTGIHGLHIIIGIGCILWLVWEAWRGTIPPENYSTVEVVSLYWHLVDAIWLFLMPVLYLAGAGYHH
jgi:cytochrome c oxidase subunit III